MVASAQPSARRDVARGQRERGMVDGDMVDGKRRSGDGAMEVNAEVRPARAVPTPRPQGEVDPLAATPEDYHAARKNTIPEPVPADWTNGGAP